MRAWITTLIMLLTFSFAVDADARKRKRKKRRKAKVTEASEETKIAISKMMGKYTWDMTAEKIIDSLELKLRAGYTPKIRGERDPLKQDRLRREMMEKVKELRKSLVPFDKTKLKDGKTPWDVSLVDKEFAYNNEESMVPNWGTRDRRFYFFYNDRLYKLFIAFNADLFKGKGFEDFAAVMEARFGPAERKYGTTIMGKPKLDHLIWPSSGGTVMKAQDETGFYGNFCLVLINTDVEENVMTGRDMNSPKKKTGSELVEAATEGKNNLSDDNENIIDQITGKDQEAPSTVGMDGPAKKKRKVDISDPGALVPEPVIRKKKKKKISADPLDGLDI